MNFNANAGTRQPSGPQRKPKRVSDVNALGAPSPIPQQFVQDPFAVPAPQQYGMGIDNNQYPGNTQFQPNYPNPGNDFSQFDYSGGMKPQQMPTQMPQPQPNYAAPQNPGFQQMPQQPIGGPQMPQFPQQFAMFQQPIVQDMAMEYGKKFADQGKQIVNSQFEKYVPVTKLKYYFAVDNRYVLNKLRLLYFPFTHKDWSMKYDQDNPVQPRYDLNAPDLYIPTMGYITYVVVAGLLLGMQNRFSPEQLGIQASSALAYSIFELIIYWITLYVANIPSSLKMLDLLAFSGYKYPMIVTVLLISIAFQKTGYFVGLLYCGATLAFFLLRTLKAKVLAEPVQTGTAPNIGYDQYGQQQPQHFDRTVARKRKVYFLFLIAGLQPVLSFWLSMHLLPSSSPSTTAS